MKIALISCSSKKNNFLCKARNMYSKSALFKFTLQYCEQQKFDKIFVLSAKHKILDLDTEIEPYDETLNKMSLIEKKKWGKEVSEWIEKNLNKEDELYIFGGKNYYQYLIVQNKIILPLLNLKIGERLKWLKENIKS
jgi:hypothetical protein